MHEAQIAIVGAGPAGVTAAVQCGRLGPKPLIMDQTGEAGGLIENAFCVENYPGLEQPLTGPQFSGRLRAHLERSRLSVFRAQLQALQRPGDLFLLQTDQGQVRANAVILATGTLPRSLGVCGEDHLSERWLFHDVRRLLACHPNPENSLVVGSGEAACDSALTLASVGCKVRMLVRGPRLKVGPRLFHLVAQEERIRVSLNSHCLSIESAFGLLRPTVRDATKGLTESILTHVMLVCVGRRTTAAQWLSALGVERTEGGVATTMSGLFVVGDARTGSLGQVGMAVGDGLQAAAAAVTYLQEGACTRKS